MGIDGSTQSTPIRPLYTRLPYGPKRIERQEVASNQRARLYGAMIEAVHRRGYAATTVAHVIALAGVSRRAFYEQFRNKEHCFLATYDIVVARQCRRVIEAWNGERGWTNRLHAACKTLLDDVANDPRGPRLVLVDALSAGSAARARLRLARLEFERLLTSAFAVAPHGTPLSPLASRAVVGGIRQIVLLRMFDGRHGELGALTDEVIDWIESYRSPAAARLGAPTGSLVLSDAASPRPPFLQGEDDRARVLRSLVDLTLDFGYARLSETQIARFAGISTAAFHEHFGGKEDCLLAVLDEFMREAMRAARESLESGAAWPQAVGGAMRAFVQHVVSDRAMRRIAFIDLFDLGPGIVGRMAGSIEAFTELLTESAPPPRRGPLLAREAVAGAIWAVIATGLAGERRARAPWLAEQLTFVVLAPYIGSKAAIAEIQHVAMQSRAA